MHLLEFSQFELKVFLGAAFVGPIGHENFSFCQIGDGNHRLAAGECEHFPHGTRVEFHQVGEVGEDAFEGLCVSVVEENTDCSSRPHPRSEHRYDPRLELLGAIAGRSNVGRRTGRRVLRAKRLAVPRVLVSIPLCVAPSCVENIDLS